MTKEYDDIIFDHAKEVASHIQTNVFDKLEDPINCLLTMSMIGLMTEVAKELASKHIPETFTNKDYRMALARACRNIAKEIQNGH